MIVSELSEKQREIFEKAAYDVVKQLVFAKFKLVVKDCKLVDPSEDNLLKWLVARSFDVDQAEKMLRRSLEWRRANRIDEVLDQWQPPAVLQKYYPMGIIGCDKLACPVWIVAFGQADWRGMLQSVSKRDYLRYISYLSEQGVAEMKKNSERVGKPVTCQTFIIDMKGLSMRQLSFKPFREVGIEGIKISEANYPENLRKTIIINAPKLFTVVFSMVKPFLHQVTLDKISIFGFDKNEWSAALLKEIDADQLPVHYGGTMIDPDGDPKCPSRISMGGEVPQSYYLEVVKPTPKDNMTPMTVLNGDKSKLEFQISELNSILRWEFMTEDCDIGFSVYCIEKNGERIDLITNERIQSHLVMEEGDIVCTRLCTYFLEFDNSFSYLRSKKVWYNVTVNLPSSSAPYEEFDGK